MLRRCRSGRGGPLRFLTRPRVRVTGRVLILVNVGCAGMALAQGIFVARELGATSLAVIGVLASALSLVANFLDIRPTDLASKFFYEERDSVARAGVLQVCILLNAAIGLCLLVVGTVVALAVSHVVLDHPPALGAVLAQSVVTSAAFVSGTPLALLRLTERLGVVAAMRITGQAVNTAAVVVAVWASGTVGGYYTGATVSALALLPLSAVVSVITWRRTGVALLARASVRAAWRRYRAQLRFLVLGSVMGYGKMLHRGADVLLVAFVTTDATTGVYRLARQLTDGLYVVFDALSTVYGPRLLSLLAENRYGEFRLSARRLLLGAVGFTALAEMGVLVGLPVVRETVLAGQYDGLVMPVALLVLPFGVVTGVHLWLWAALIDQGRLGVLVAPAIVGAITQVAALLVVVPLVGRTAGWAAAAYVLYYVIAYSWALMWIARHRPEVLPRRRRRRGLPT
jgi:O-antigen/teichoic acid export membrane protein